MTQIERITTVCSHRRVKFTREYTEYHRVFKSILSTCKGDEHEVRRGYKNYSPQITQMDTDF